MRFTKMHGLGNDYVYVDCFAEPTARTTRPRWPGAISDRHFGIGGDGLILICPSRAWPTPACGCSTPTAPSRRCAATASAASPSTSTTTASPRKPQLKIETGRGVLTLQS